MIPFQYIGCHSEQKPTCGIYMHHIREWNNCQKISWFWVTFWKKWPNGLFLITWMSLTRMKLENTPLKLLIWCILMSWVHIFLKLWLSEHCSEVTPTFDHLASGPLLGFYHAFTWTIRLRSSNHMYWSNWYMLCWFKAIINLQEPCGYVTGSLSNTWSVNYYDGCFDPFSIVVWSHLKF